MVQAVVSEVANLSEGVSVCVAAVHVARVKRAYGASDGVSYRVAVEPNNSFAHGHSQGVGVVEATVHWIVSA